MSRLPNESTTETRVLKPWILFARVGVTLVLAAAVLLLVLLSHQGGRPWSSGAFALGIFTLVSWRFFFWGASTILTRIVGVILLMACIFAMGLNLRHIHSGDSIFAHFELSLSNYSWQAEGCDHGSAPCLMNGICGFIDGQCVATLKGCESSIACESAGFCGLKDGLCIATADGCKASSNLCPQSGQCGFASGECVATADGCAASKWACQKWGKCTLIAGQCAATLNSCRLSTACKTLGYCGFINGQCVRTEHGCENATLSCKERNLCRFKDGECVQ